MQQISVYLAPLRIVASAFLYAFFTRSSLNLIVCTVGNKSAGEKEGGGK